MMMMMMMVVVVVLVVVVTMMTITMMLTMTLVAQVLHNRVSHPGVYDFADNHDGSIELPLLQHLASAECKYTGVVVMNAIHRCVRACVRACACVPDVGCSNDDMEGIWAQVPDAAKFDAGSLGPDGTGIGGVCCGGCGGGGG